MPRYNRDVCLAFPSIFVIPSYQKGGQGDSGGQSQARFSFKHPAVQTNPPEVNKCLVSRFEGGVIGEADLGQSEMRHAACLSGDASLLKLFDEGICPHTDLSIRCEGPDVVNHLFWKSGIGGKDPRQIYKQGNFLILYRGSARKFQLVVLKESGHLLHWEFCNSTIQSLWSLRTGLHAWQERIIHDSHKRGYLEMPITGHSRYTFEGADKDVTVIVNIPVQASSALTLQDIQNCFEYLLQINGLMPYIIPFQNRHDAIYSDIAPGYEPIWKECVIEAFNYCVTRGYYARLCNWTGYNPPLIMEYKLK